MCKDGCVIVGTLLELLTLLGEEGADDALDSVEWFSQGILEKYPCYQAVQEGEFADFHISYAVTAYAAAQGHLKCLKKLHGHELSWHACLALVAAENDQLDCLQYIVEEMGDVTYTDEDVQQLSSARCRDYLQKAKEIRNNKEEN